MSKCLWTATGEFACSGKPLPEPTAAVKETFEEAPMSGMPVGPSLAPLMEESGRKAPKPATGAAPGVESFQLGGGSCGSCGH